MAKLRTAFVCQSCGYTAARWLGRCPDCSSWNSFQQETGGGTVKNQPLENLSSSETGATSKPVRLRDIVSADGERYKTNMPELDRVLSGGIVKGSVVLVAGDPGIGKSTLLLQICQSVGDNGYKTLYVSGEESAAQIKLRAERLGIHTDNLLLLAETNMEIVENTANHENPHILIIDSIQTVYRNGISSSPGSVTQIRECVSLLIKIAKHGNVAVLIVGHSTKEGQFAGPRTLEHMVDAALYFEGERHLSYRVLRAVKNRFGGTNEIGVFEMTDSGLRDIKNPSAHMLAGRPLNAPGSVVTTVMEGTRPIVTEVQALVTKTNFPMPRRMTTGTDFNRVNLIIAVIEKRLGINLGVFDIYINIAGGIKIMEPSADCAIASAILSSFRNKPVGMDTCVIGEIGLTGEIRAVTNCLKRLTEAYKMGFSRCIAPNGNKDAVNELNKARKTGVNSVLVSGIAGLPDALFIE